MVDGRARADEDWDTSASPSASPPPCVDGRVVSDPVNLGKRWVGFDFEAAFGKPTKVINDAAMQALGSYDGGRMLFLGLGTGLGTTLVIDGVVAPMELGHLPYRKATFEDYVGEAGASATATSAGGSTSSRRSTSTRGAPARLRRPRRRQRERARRAAAELPSRPQRGRVPRRLPPLGRGLTERFPRATAVVLAAGLAVARAPKRKRR